MASGGKLRKTCSASLTRWEKPKTSLAKYSIEFNDFAVQTRPHRTPYLRLLGRPFTLLYVRRSVADNFYPVFQMQKSICFLRNKFQLCNLALKCLGLSEDIKY